MNKKIFSLVAVFSTAILFAAPRTPMQAALDKVDQGGEWLYAGSMAKEYQKFINNVPNLKDPQAQLQQKLVRKFYKILGMQLIQAQANSSKEVSPGCWVCKNYAYLGKKNMDLPNIYRFFGNTDRQLDWVDLPANTIIAASIDIKLDKFYALLRDEFSTDDEFKAMFLNIENIVKSRNVDPEKLAASLNGTFKLCIAGSSPADLAIRISIPDREGELAAIIRRELKLNAKAADATLPFFFMPVKVKFNKDSVTLANPTPLNQADKLGNAPAFANYLSHIGRNGNSYFLINLTPQLINTLNAMMPPQIKKILVLKPFSGIMVGKHDAEGIYSIGAANFSGTKMIAVGASSLMSSILLPAVSGAREKARQAHCINNLKQIGLAILMYANDNKDKFPAANGINGLQKLIDQEYIGINIFSCASKPAQYADGKLSTDCPYIYIGGIYEKVPANASNLPLAFEKPGYHKGVNKVNVLFADGHVEALPVTDYNTPAQVIGILNAENKYPAELLDKMVRAVAEN